MRALVLLAVIALGPYANAEDCEVTAHEPEISLQDHYVDWDLGCQPNCEPNGPGGRIFGESNGIEGLQRQDEEIDNTCGGRVPGDHVVLTILRS